MKLHSLSSIKSQRVQRVGRGGKRGHTSGRGTKGQHSRAGRRIRPAERDLIIRIPKKRGFRNKPKSDKVTTFNIGFVAEKLKSFVKGGAPLVVDLTLLKTAGVLGKHFSGEIKFLGNGEITFPVSIQEITVSDSAKQKIEKAGGKVGI